MGRVVGSFHPLKAGRRLPREEMFDITILSFHPLKAGRRRRWGVCARLQYRLFPSPQGGSETRTQRSWWQLGIVSIPSRRVGDVSLTPSLAVGCRVFPSPQGGSETVIGRKETVTLAKFPSPQGGSETTNQPCSDQPDPEFPSPQGGSETCPSASMHHAICGFHPLKAGRRLVWDNETHTHYTRFPSPQGGSETSSPPLKVSLAATFPSPQGGSETGGSHLT